MTLAETVLFVSDRYEAIALGFQFLYVFATIALATVGLAIIFGMMGVINLAHGEFVLVGIYGTALAYHAGVPLAAAMAVGVLVTAVFGVIVERTIVQHLYDRLLDSMVATWGLALALSQLLLIIFGSSLDSISTPLQWVDVGPYDVPLVGVEIPQLVVGGTIEYGPYTSGIYRSVVLPAAAVLALVTLYLLFTRTEYGVKARATIEDPDTARTMGVDTDRMYVTTFALGSAFAGLAGALFAPVLGSITPDRGSGFLVDSFVAVVVGGPSVIVGTLSAAGLLGAVNGSVSFALGTFWGQMGMLLVAIFVLRFLPDGITGYVDAWRRRRRAEA